MKKRTIFVLCVLVGIGGVAALLYSQPVFSNVVAGTYLLQVIPPRDTGLAKIWTCSNFGEGGQITTSTGLDFGKGPTGLTVTCPTTGEELFLGKFRSPGYGTWSRTSMNKIGWTILTERFDEEGHHLGFERLQGVSSISPSGQLTGTLKLEYFDDDSDPISGTPTCTFTDMTYTARRIPQLNGHQDRRER